MAQFKACSCGGEHLERIHRAGWMRLIFPSRSLYYCSKCSREFLLTAAAYLQASSASLESKRVPID